MPEAPIDAVVAGHICLDISPSFSTLRPDAGLPELLRPGSLTQVGGAIISTGGSVSNTGLNLLQLGMRVELMGKIGDDLFARGILDLLAPRGLDKTMVRVPGEQTSYTIVVAPPGIDRVFLHCPGANDTFGADDIQYAVVARSRLFHLGYPPLMRRLYQNGGVELADVFRRVKALGGVATSLDMSLPDPSSEAGRADWTSILAVALPAVDFFLPSAEEILYMLERDRFLDLRGTAARERRDLVDFVTGDDVVRIGRRLLDLGVKIALIKCGRRGLYARTASAAALQHVHLFRDPAQAALWADKELWRATFAVDRVVSATGAGDSAIAGFLAAALLGLDLEASLEMACAVGASNVTAMDALSGVRSWDDTRRMIADGWKSKPIDVQGAHWRLLTPGVLWAGPNHRGQ